MMRTQALVGRWLVLLLLLATLATVDLYGFGLNHVMLGAPLALLAMAALDAAALLLLLTHARGSGWRVAFAVGVLFFGVKVGLVALEAFYLPDVLPPTVLRPLLVNGLFSALVVAGVTRWWHGRGASAAAATAWARPSTLPGWIWRLAAAGLLWLLLFVAGGLLIFRPLALALDAPVATAYLDAFTPANPLLILGFQWARGVLWALLALPILAHLGGTHGRRGLVLGSIFAIWMASGLLLPNDLLPATIVPAHLAEVALENLLFGLGLAWLFVGRTRLPMHRFGTMGGQ
jgi:hypothetical protein